MTLRQLSTLYLMAASGFVIAIGFSHHPDWRHNAEAAASYVRLHGGEAAVAVNDHVIRPSAAFIGRESVALYESAHERWAPAPVRVAAPRPAPQRVAVKTKPVLHVVPPPAIAQATPPKPIEQVANSASPPIERYVPHLVRITPALRPAIVPESPAQVANEAPQPEKQEKQAKLTLAPEAMASRESAPATTSTFSPPSSVPPSSGEIARVEQRLRDSLTSEMFENFGLFLYVSKAAAGPWAQHMYVFQKQANGDLALLHTWPVSTGREKVEFNAAGLKLPSFTPAGYYQLDPKRFYPHYRSVQWDQPMPYAMFFNWVDRGDQTGLAIHGAAGEDVGLLGTRASAGCIRLAPENARVLFSLIRENYKGLTPKFAYDKRTATMMNNGMLLHDVDGRVQLANGYKVLVFIENYGGENVVAALF